MDASLHQCAALLDTANLKFHVFAQVNCHDPITWWIPHTLHDYWVENALTPDPAQSPPMELPLTMLPHSADDKYVLPNQSQTVNLLCLALQAYHTHRLLLLSMGGSWANTHFSQDRSCECLAHKNYYTRWLCPHPSVARAVHYPARPWMSGPASLRSCWLRVMMAPCWFRSPHPVPHRPTLRNHVDVDNADNPWPETLLRFRPVPACHDETLRRLYQQSSR